MSTQKSLQPVTDADWSPDTTQILLSAYFALVFNGVDGGKVHEIEIPGWAGYGTGDF